jgi:hypothetical protein
MYGTAGRGGCCSGEHLLLCPVWHTAGILLPLLDNTLLSLLLSRITVTVALTFR